MTDAYLRGDKRGKFCGLVQSLLSFVRFQADHETIQRELQAHYEDHVKDLERIGYDAALAKERALNAMGDPEEVGQAMDRAHKPWLGWLWLLSRWGVIAAIYAAVFCVLLLGGQSFLFRNLLSVKGTTQWTF